MKLLPCPFCGWDSNEDYDASVCAQQVNDELKEGDDGYYIFPSQVICVGCGAAVIGGETTEEAIKAWNTRADKDHYLQMAVEAVEGIIQKGYVDSWKGAHNRAAYDAIKAIKQRFSEE